MLDSANYAQKLLLFDALSGVFRIVKLRGRSKTCAINGDEPTIHALIDYEQFCRAGPNDKVCKTEENKTKKQLLPALIHLENEVFLVVVMQTPAQHVLAPEDRMSCQELQQLRGEGQPHLLLDVREKVQFQICSLSDSLSKLPSHHMMSSFPLEYCFFNIFCHFLARYSSEGAARSPFST